MSMTLVEKILAKKSGQAIVRPDEIVEVSIDLAMTHDALGAHTIARFNELGIKRVWDAEKIVVIPDHYVPNKDIDTAKKCLNIKKFVIEQGIENYYEVGKGGICHQVLVEKGHFPDADFTPAVHKRYWNTVSASSSFQRFRLAIVSTNGILIILGGTGL